MLESYVRPLYQTYFANYIAKLFKAVSPWHITALACLVGVMVAPALLFNLPRLAIGLLLFSGFLDTLDGSIARETGTTSDVGTVVDIVADRIVEFAVILGLFMVDPSQRALTTITMLGSCYICITSFLVIGIFTPNHSQKGFNYSSGIIERAEAFIFFIMMIWIPNYFNLLGIMFIVLVLLTSYLHLRRFIKNESFIMAKTTLYSKRF